MQVDEDYRGLYALLQETRTAFRESSEPQRIITMAYYPDVRVLAFGFRIYHMRSSSYKP